ncbi:hypothetical protein GCM10023155_40370 [Bremerella cremea]
MTIMPYTQPSIWLTALTFVLLIGLASCARQPSLESPVVLDQVTDVSFDREVLKSSIPVLVVMTANWCPNCARAKPSLQEMSERLQGKVHVREVDAERNRFLAEKYDVHQYPTYLIFDAGTLQERFVGDEGVDRVREIFNR